MTMELAALLDPSLVLIDMEARDSADAITRLGELLFSRGYVDDRFVAAALAREAKFPTGLATQGMHIALPHAETEYVRTSRVAIGILRETVPFHRMDDPQNLVQAKAVFMLAIADPNTQVLALQQLAELFQDGVTLARVAAARSPEHVLEALLEGLRRLEAKSFQ